VCGQLQPSAIGRQPSAFGFRLSASSSLPTVSLLPIFAIGSRGVAGHEAAGLMADG
jgi:hypothetical protein